MKKVFYMLLLTTLLSCVSKVNQWPYGTNLSGELDSTVPVTVSGISATFVESASSSAVFQISGFTPKSNQEVLISWSTVYPYNSDYWGDVVIKENGELTIAKLPSNTVIRWGLFVLDLGSYGQVTRQLNSEWYGFKTK